MSNKDVCGRCNYDYDESDLTFTDGVLTCYVCIKNKDRCSSCGASHFQDDLINVDGEDVCYYCSGEVQSRGYSRSNWFSSDRLLVYGFIIIMIAMLFKVI